jgi:hypothetical protein
VFKFLKVVFILGFMVGGWVLAAASLHVVRGAPTHKYCPLNVQLVTKEKMSFKDTWVDLTKWTSEDVAAHRDVVVRLEEAGKLKLLEDTLAKSSEKTADSKADRHDRHDRHDRAVQASSRR